MAVEQDNDRPIDGHRLGRDLKLWLKRMLDLRTDKEDDYRTIEILKADVDFRGTKLWILVCAIFIASLGLNVNSTAVIIGAMLISPLMGPIIGFGLGLGISDFDLIKRSLRNLALTTLFSIFTATVYFFISPLSQAQSELLARTQPTIYDVLIAFFGGAAGIIAGSTKSKGNVIPGVAIATALMPPLCTAGYGLAIGNLHYFFGAFYLYIINSVFIGLATLIFVRLLKFPRKVFVDKTRGKRVRQIVLLIVVGTIVPSIYLSIGMIRSSYDEQAAVRFVKEQLTMSNNQVISQRLTTEKGQKQLEIVMLGPRLSPAAIDSVGGRLASYGLKEYTLVVKQGFGEETNMTELRSVLLKDLYDNSEKIIRRQQVEIDSLHRVLDLYHRYGGMELQLNREIATIFPDIKKAKLLPSAGMMSGRDSVLMVLIERDGTKKLSAEEQRKMSHWLEARTEAKKVKIILN